MLDHDNQRRHLLKLMAAAALSACAPLTPNSKTQRVVVCGAGIIGASIAYHLAKSGAAVTVIDKEAPASHASRATFAWINATWAKQPQHYHNLNQQSVSHWHSIQKELGLPIRWQGSVEWFSSEQRQQKLEQQIAEQQLWGEAARMLTPEELASMEPQLKVGSATRFAFSGNDGAINPVLATHALLNAAKAMGADVRYPCTLQETSVFNGRLQSVGTSCGEIKADKLVLATGAATNAAKDFAGIDIPQRSTPGIIGWTKPMPRLINRIIVAPGIHMHQRDDGRIVLGEQEGAPKTGAHKQRLADRPNEFPVKAIAEEHGKRMLAIAKRFVPAIGQAEIEEVYIGWRPLPLDGHPVLGVSPNKPDVYLAIMHSGVSLAPVVGQLAANEITNETAHSALGPYRPSREFAHLKRY
ncbi:MAG: NAD(P)/FAD-dependent oxidoreductase [Pseudomonadales bacterium]